MAKTVKQCLERGNEDEAFHKVSETKDVLKWRDEGNINMTLIHHAAYNNRNTFLQKLFEDEEVFIIFK